MILHPAWKEAQIRQNPVHLPTIVGHSGALKSRTKVYSRAKVPDIAESAQERGTLLASLDLSKKDKAGYD
jgi:hypothetical protein